MGSGKQLTSLDKEDYRKRLRDECLASSTVTHYIEGALAVEKLLFEGDRCTDPRKISGEDVMYLLEIFRSSDYTIGTRKGYMLSLRKWCLTYGNPSVPDWPTARFPPDRRPRADWLTPDQVKALLSADLTTIQRVAIHLELNLGLRRVEVIRMKVQDLDFDKGIIRIRGKGAMGDKPRMIPFTRETGRIVGDWLAERDKWIEYTKFRYPKTFRVPEELIVWIRGGRIYPYSERGSGFDKRICRSIRQKVGFRFSNHTLRRTLGRTLYRSGVPAPTIAKILGHESPDTTLMYIGIDIDDMKSALDCLNMEMIDND